MQSLTALVVFASLLTNVQSIKSDPVAYEQEIYSVFNEKIAAIITSDSEIGSGNETLANKDIVQNVLGLQTETVGVQEDLVPTLTSTPPIEPEALTTTPTMTPEPTEVQNPTPTWSPENYDVVGAVRSASEEFGVDISLMNQIATCESRFNPYAHNERYDYAGLYQFNQGTWISTRTRMGADPDPSLRFSAKEAARTAAFKIKNDGAGAWSGCL